MSYATPDDLVQRYGYRQLVGVADRDGSGLLDDDTVARALEDARDEIDSYIGKRYRLPLASVPRRLVTVAADIAFYRLHPGAHPEDVRRRYEDALRFLRDVADGRAVLDADGAEPASVAGGVEVAGPPRVFSRDSLKGM